MPPSSRLLSSLLLVFLLVVVTLNSAHAQLSIDDYAPDTNIECPSTPLLRVFSASEQVLNPQEVEFGTARDEIVADAWEDWIGDGSGLGYADIHFVTANASKVGIAVSGGSFRASLYGAGVLNALDARNGTAKAAGTGGLLQVSSYISALSGGSWLISSLYSNGFPEIPSLVFGTEDGFPGWLLDLNLFLPGGIDPFNEENQAFYGSVAGSVLAKAKTGIFTSLTDAWSRALSYHFLNQTTRDNFFTNDSAHGAGQLWSQITTSEAYRNHEAPFPIVLVNSRPQSKEYSGDLTPEAPVYEFSPLEFVSFDPSVSAAMDLKYMGSALSEGRPVNDSSCVHGLDETGFVLGTSSSLFNAIFDQASDFAMDAKELGVIADVFQRVVEEVQTKDNDVANWPNPFKGIARSTYVDTNSDWLELIDGGLNGENIPLGPLFVKSRELDVIVAIDATANTDDSFPTGDSLLRTENRTSLLLKDTHQSFPPLANSEEDLVNAGINMRPTFFGCDPQNSPPEYPLVIYLPNSPPLNGDDPVSNTNTFKLGYTQRHQHIFLDQVFNNTIGGFTPNSNEPDDEFGKCLQCAAVDRARLKATPVVGRSTFCGQCFKQYCFDPSNPPNKGELPNRQQAFVDPDAEALKSFFQRHKGAIIGGIVGGVVFVILVAGVIIYLCCFKVRKAVLGQKYKLVPLLGSKERHGPVQ